MMAQIQPDHLKNHGSSPDLYIHIHTHIRTETYTHPHMHRNTVTHTHTYMHTHIYRHIHKYNTHTHTHMYTCLEICHNYLYDLQRYIKSKILLFSLCGIYSEYKIRAEKCMIKFIIVLHLSNMIRHY